RGMELSGLVVHVMGDLYRPAAPDPAATLAASGPRWRAAAVRRLAEPLIPGPWVAIGRTVAWVHAGGPAPGVLEASVGRYHRRPLVPGPLPLRLEQSGLAPAPRGGDEAGGATGDVVEVHGLWCTSVDRTIEDLLRAGPAGPERAVARSLVPLSAPGRLRDRFQSRRRRPGMAAARSALHDLLEAQDRGDDRQRP
ncbi:MAG TPA: hypothetical protein VIG75_07190, partial [Citricoccus sp.]